MLRFVLMVFVFSIGAILYLVNFHTTRLQYQANRAVSRKKQYENRWFYALREKIATRIIRYININEEKRELQALMMLTSGVKGTPEQYLAKTLSEVLLVFLVGVAFFIVTNNIFTIGIAAMCCCFYLSFKSKRLSKEYVFIQKEVSLDLAKLCNVISGKLSSTSSVENILKSYYSIANGAMRLQMEITLADMRTGNIAVALSRLENRIRLPRLSDICRGLIAIHNGNDQRLYFEIKANEIMREHETLIEQDIVKRPGKLRLLQGILFALFLCCILYPFWGFISSQFLLFS